jgi:uncharacterized membrane protein
MKSRIQRPDWSTARGKLTDLSSEDEKILDLLIQGRTQPEIGEELGMHRSAVWRRVTRLRKRLDGTAEN